MYAESDDDEEEEDDEAKEYCDSVKQQELARQYLDLTRKNCRMLDEYGQSKEMLLFGDFMTATTCDTLRICFQGRQQQADMSRPKMQYRLYGIEVICGKIEGFFT